MLKNIGFEFLLASPPNYRYLVAEIYYNGRFVALVNQERGAGMLDVEFPGSEVMQSKVTREVELQGFIEALESASRRLTENGLRDAGDSVPTGAAGKS
jgi:hypothetical protein